MFTLCVDKDMHTLLQILVERGADVNQCDCDCTSFDKSTTFWYQDGGVYDDEKTTALTQVLQNNGRIKVETMLDAGADVTDIEMRNACFPSTYSTSTLSTHAFCCFLKYGARLDASLACELRYRRRQTNINDFFQISLIFHKKRNATKIAHIAIASKKLGLPVLLITKNYRTILSRYAAVALLENLQKHNMSTRQCDFCANQ